MATFLRMAGRDEEAWEFLSSVIDQKPNDANSYFQVGQWYRGQHDLARAVRWMGEAPQWDTANPEWLFHYGSVLKELGRKSEANVQFKKIINGKWANGLQNWVDRARNEL
jgi:tetratricopeptide (TPR) repeat protein